MRHKKQTLWIVVVLLIVLLAKSTTARADGYLITEDTTTSSIMADQKAVLIHRAGHEDLIISVGLDLQSSNPQEMAWIIPVPSRPEVQITEHELFDVLDEISAPEIIYKSQRSGGWAFGGQGAAAPPPLVEVLERKQVGIYDVAVLAGQEAGSLLDWLHEEGFHVSDVLQPPLDAYIAEGWTFVAMRLAPDAGQGEVQDAQPVWLSFDTERLVYPMRLTAAHGKSLALRLYILADHRYELDGFAVEFAGLAQVNATDPALATVLDREFFFSKLFNQAVTPAEMATDFYPFQAPSDEPYREQIVHTHVVTGPGFGLGEIFCICGLCWLGLLGLLAAIVVAIVLLRRRK
jgi:hypothetical protein